MNIKTAQKQAHSKKAMNNKNRDECLPLFTSKKFSATANNLTKLGAFIFKMLV